MPEIRCQHSEGKVAGSVRETGAEPDRDIGVFPNGGNWLNEKAGFHVPPAIGANGIATRIDACKDRVEYRGEGLKPRPEPPAVPAGSDATTSVTPTAKGGRR